MTINYIDVMRAEGASDAMITAYATALGYLHKLQGHIDSDDFGMRSAGRESLSGWVDDLEARVFSDAKHKRDIDAMRAALADYVEQRKVATVATLPDSVAFAVAFRAVFAAVVSGGYSALDEDFDDADPDDIRCELNSAVCEAAGYFPYMPRLTAEVEGALTDLVLETYTDLNEFLIRTSE